MRDSGVAHSPRVQDVPLFPEVPPGEVSTLRVSTHVDNDVNHVLLGDEVRGQGQVQQPGETKGQLTLNVLVTMVT